MTMAEHSDNIRLKRSIGLPALIFYGVGTMVGGGIYALLGKVTLEADTFAPWSMIVAGLMALISAFSFAELSSRFPSSGGSAFYISKAFNRPALGAGFGWLVILTGVVSAATLTVAAGRFLFDLLAWPPLWSQLLVVGVLFAIAAWGITQSVAMVAIITCIEVAGLLFVIGYNSDAVVSGLSSIEGLLPGADFTIWVGIISGSFLAFYAFLGFEDMVTLAEEVKGVKRTLPIAVVVSIVITMTLYVVVSFVAIQLPDRTALVESNSPMASLIVDNQWISPRILIAISLLAGLNGALVQIVMASRMLYGMGKENQAPQFFRQINAITRTPIVATLVASLIVLLLAWLFELTVLAKLTSGIILLVFSAVNLALCKVKLTLPKNQAFSVPLWLPAFGALMSIALLIFAIWHQFVMT